MAANYVTTRVTNPRRKRMARRRMSRAARAAWSQKMQRAKRAKRGGRRRNASPRRRSANPRRKYAETARVRRDRAQRKTYKRRRNAATGPKVGGVRVYDAIWKAVGLILGAYVGAGVTNWVSRTIVSRFPQRAQGLGFLATGTGTIIAGIYLQRRAKKLPIETAFYGLAAPQLIRGLDQMGMIPGTTRTMPVQDTVTGEVGNAEITTAGHVRRFNGRRTAGTLLTTPGLSGTLQPGNMVSTMAGSIQQTPSSVMYGRGRFVGA